MADMMKAMGASGGKRGVMGKLGQMMGMGGGNPLGGMPQPSPEQLEAFQKKMGGAGAPSGIPDAPPPGAFKLPPSFPGLGGPAAKLPGLGGGMPGGFNPFGDKKK